MPVKSFTSGFAGGLSGALKRLDDCVAELGDVKIISITDAIYPDKKVICEPDSRMARVVVYELTQSSSS